MVRLLLMRCDSIKNLCRSLLDVVQRLRQYVGIAVVKLDIVGAMFNRIQPKGSTDDMRYAA